MDKEQMSAWLWNEILKSEPEAEITDAVIAKVNGAKKGWNVRKKDAPIGVVIYPDHMYEQHQSGMPLAEISEQLKSVLASAQHVAVPEFTREEAKSHVYLAMVNLDKNRELMDSCAHVCGGDVAAIPRWRVSAEMSCIVTNELQQKLMMTREELMAVARRNTEERGYTIQPIRVVIEESLKKEGVPDETIDLMLGDEAPPMLVVTTPDGLDGAAAMLSKAAMSRACDMAGCTSGYVLPSSRHECLFLPEYITDHPEELCELVEQVNSDCVDEQDFLSDSVFFFDSITQTLSMLSDSPDLDEGMEDAGMDVNYERGMRL